MAKFLKVELVNGSFSLIPVAEIAGITAEAVGPDVEITITLVNGSSTYLITMLEQSPSITDTLESFNNALIANPGGIVSTVVPPIVTAQVPAAQSGKQGRIVVTTPAKYGVFDGVTFTP